MVKVQPSFFAFVLVLGAVACTSPYAKPMDVIIPNADSITIYSIGGSVVSGTIDSAVVGTRRLRLPPTARGVNLSQNNESAKWFTVQAIQEPKKDATSAEKKTAASADEKYELVGLPPLKPGELKFNYMLPEITWQPQLNATIIDSKTLSLQLQAAITVGAYQEYKHCNVTLVLNNAVSVEKLSGQSFSLSSFDLYPSRNITYNLDNKTLEYSLIREWNTYVGSDEVHVLIQVNNPFTIDLNQTNFSVESNQINIESGSIANQVRPGEALFLGAGIDDTIYTFRSIKTTESPDKKPLPFNHKITYEITNKSGQEKKLRIVSSRIMGTEHKSVYHFSKQPDAIPENALIWILTLKPNSTQTLEYDYDADVKDVNGENGFEQGM